MTINIDGYQVEIKAKNQWNNRYNKKDTMALLNLLNIWILNAGNYYDELGHKGLRDMSWRESDKMYEMLKENGYFN